MVKAENLYKLQNKITANLSSNYLIAFLGFLGQTVLRNLAGKFLMCIFI